MFAPSLSSGSVVPLRSDPDLAIFNDNNDSMNKPAVAARELECLAGFHFPAFAVYALGIATHDVKLA
jgi:hypothetical protein